MTFETQLTAQSAGISNLKANAAQVTSFGVTAPISLFGLFLNNAGQSDTFVLETPQTESQTQTVLKPDVFLGEAPQPILDVSAPVEDGSAVALIGVETGASLTPQLSQSRSLKEMAVTQLQGTNVVPIQQISKDGLEILNVENEQLAADVTLFLQQLQRDLKTQGLPLEALAALNITPEQIVQYTQGAQPAVVVGPPKPVNASEKPLLPTQNTNGGQTLEGEDIDLLLARGDLSSHQKLLLQNMEQAIKSVAVQAQTQGQAQAQAVPTQAAPNPQTPGFSLMDGTWIFMPEVELGMSSFGNNALGVDGIMHGSPELVRAGLEGNAYTSLTAQAKASVHNHPATQSVANHVAQAALGKDGSTMTLRLDPPELGRVNVRLDFSDDGAVRAKILVEKADTYMMLQRDVHALERALAEAGLETDSGSLEFELAEDNGDGEQKQGSGEHKGSPFDSENNDDDTIYVEMTGVVVDPNTGLPRINIMA